MWDKQAAFRRLPAVHRLLSLDLASERLGEYPLSRISDAFAAVLADLRQWFEETTPDESAWDQAIAVQNIVERARAVLERQFLPRLRPVLNLTGVVIHTNLGRAPLSQRALEQVAAVAAGYSNLEYDLELGERGSRHSHIEQRICDLTGAQSAVVVNNNAAAVFLVLQELAHGSEAVVSRGQLVEIGGSFRIPDIMKLSGVELVEVGTTNKTKLRDYEAAVTERTKLILRVHTSNFRIVGFTEQPALADLVELAHSHDLPVFEDLGSGALYDYAHAGIGDEKTIQESVRASVDVVSFSGDKLLGGGQAGIIVGKKRYIDRLKKNPLMRALRPDKMTLAALEATLIAHLDGELAKEVPVVRMLTEPQDSLAARCEQLFARVKETGLLEFLDVAVDNREESQVGGGALPLELLPTTVLRLTPKAHSAQHLFDQLRRVPAVPVIGRIVDNTVILDVRTLLPGQEEDLVNSLRELRDVYARP
ncbi:L-seryl-tRNA(Sec) selenium transferase [Alicyclobacillus tolerans]|uniref:L-seryl-tRNA(Sec) selenium transferase n=1 Tax=Alicyclobacillus tolerans TaxID=90970 RepID=UPI001EFFEB0B|nr:L-seryl-tRNA(Sec) selenium transferase [Alicyclobacillus tolerans]MCF8563282.1 L-seryl-tRNA(Sec) selenium transferase [Alicyclobacillus tolerans]